MLCDVIKQLAVKRMYTKTWVVADGIACCNTDRTAFSPVATSQFRITRNGFWTTIECVVHSNERCSKPKYWIVLIGTVPSLVPSLVQSSGR